MTTLNRRLSQARTDASFSNNTLKIPCARGYIWRANPDKPGWRQHIQAGCRKLSCPNCTRYKTRLYKKAIIAAAQKHKLIRMITLTLDPGLIPPTVDSVVYIQRVWNRFRRWLDHHKGLKLTYIRVVEFHRNGTAHYHIVTKECISQDELIEAWRECGGGHQCRISIPKKMDPARYASKYISKELTEQLPKGARVVASSQSVPLFKDLPVTDWHYTRISFFWTLAGFMGVSYAKAYTSSVQNYFDANIQPMEEEPWTFTDLIAPPRQPVLFG